MDRWFPPPSRPRPASGIRARSRRGEIGESWWSRRFIEILESFDIPRGDAGLSRRAKTASGLSAVVVRWSSSRRRYERQGMLVEGAALEKAERRGLD